MPKAAQIQASSDPSARVHRREFLCLAPSAALASTIPLGLTSPRPARNLVSIGEALNALWNGPEDRSASIIKPSTIWRLDGFTFYPNVGLISASRSDLTAEENDRRAAELFAYIWPRFGCFDVDVCFTEGDGPLFSRRLTERAYLLRGAGRFDSGNLKGFLRQHGAIHDQGLVLYKPFGDRCAYLLGTQDGVVPRRKQIVCVGEFKAARLPDYFSLIRDQGSRINVESMRFPIRKSFFNRGGGEH